METSKAMAWNSDAGGQTRSPLLSRVLATLALWLTFPPGHPRWSIEMPTTLTGRFETRREAELAIEHLVQQEGLDRKAISVLPLGNDNSAGTQIAGSDQPDGNRDSRERDDAALTGPIEISVALLEGDAEAVRRALEIAGARNVRDL
jgi:hypothetical protein